MSSDPPGSLRRPGPVVGGLIMLTVWMLPAEHRTRYEDEFRAELVDVPIARRVRHAVGLLIGSIALRVRWPTPELRQSSPVAGTGAVGCDATAGP